MKYFLQIVGILMLIVFGARMFGFLETFIVHDVPWLCLLFGGILVCMLGFWIEEYQTIPLSRIQKERRVSKMAACRNAVCLCMVVLIMLLSSYI